MYLSFAFAFLSSAYWLVLPVMGVNPWLVILLPTAQIILEIPLTFRYLRVAWLALDHAFDPGRETKWL